MEFQNSRFSSEVYKSGYKVLEAETVAARLRGDNLHRKAPYLTTGLPLGEGGDSRIINKVLPPGLFLEFAQTNPDTEGILRFANEYGLLGGGITERISIPGGTGSTITTGETIERWIQEIKEVRIAADTWDGLKKKRKHDPENGEYDTLKRYFVWEELEDDQPSTVPELDGIAVLRVHPELDSLLDRLDPEWNKRVFPPFSEAKPAALLLRMLVNWHLAEGYKLGLVDQEVSEPQFQLNLISESLISIIWLQLVEAIVGNKKFRQCTVCGRWLEVSPKRSRMPKLYCSDACRAKAYRQGMANTKSSDFGLELETWGGRFREESDD